MEEGEEGAPILAIHDTTGPRQNGHFDEAVTGSIRSRSVHDGVGHSGERAER
jgi:hypothetical protein